MLSVKKQIIKYLHRHGVYERNNNPETLNKVINQVEIMTNKGLEFRGCMRRVFEKNRPELVIKF